MNTDSASDESDVSELTEFLKRARISEGTWQESELRWDTLRSIGEAHNASMDDLRDTAEMFARIIQRIGDVHSVRWRIKDTDHLLEKIVRKCAERKDKYLGINADNYHSVVTDLVGVRALHLFKEDFLGIDSALRAIWDSQEDPIAYVREGDPDSLNKLFEAQGFKVQRHDAGYRSIHYIFSSRPAKRMNLVEVQVRTIFEEGWSEIDHKVRYPNFSNDPQVAYFLTIFNRLAGSADEMGTFAKRLTIFTSEHHQKLAEAAARNDRSVSEIDRLVSELEAVKQKDKDTKRTIEGLRKELSKLRENSPTSIQPSLANPLGAGGLSNNPFGVVFDVESTAAKELRAMQKRADDLQAAANPFKKFADPFAEATKAAAALKGINDPLQPFRKT